MDKNHWSLEDVVKNSMEFNVLCDRNNDISERDAAEQIGVPRTTLRAWNQREQSSLLPTSVHTALQTEDGLDYLQKLINIIQFACTQSSFRGTRLVEVIMNASGLGSLVSCSYGALHARTVEMEDHINQFGSDETARLSKDMPHKNISLAKDETFNKNKPCLVGIEPVSNYIITETYTEKRTSDDWTKSLTPILSELNVTVIQNVNDNGSAIKKYNREQHADANDSQDLWHIMNKSNQSIVGPLSSKQRSCEKKIESILVKIEKKTSKIKRLLASDSKEKHKKDKVSKLEAECRQLSIDKSSEENNLQKVIEWKQRHNTVNQSISHQYHPYDLENGNIRSVEDLQNGLDLQYAELKMLGKEMSLSEKSLDRIDSAAEYTASMLSTMRFYFNTIDARCEAWRAEGEAE
jgi:hypothetical protein